MRWTLILLALLTGCAIRPTIVHNITRDRAGCYHLDGHPIRRADTGALWCDPPA